MPPPSPAPDSKRLRAGFRLARLCGTIWRETGAERGDFLLQTATIGGPDFRDSRSGAAGTSNSTNVRLTRRKSTLCHNGLPYHCGREQVERFDGFFGQANKTRILSI